MAKNITLFKPYTRRTHVHRLLSKRKLNNSKQGWQDYFLKGRVADGGGMRNALPQFNYFHFHAAFGNNNRLAPPLLGLMPPAGNTGFFLEC